MSQLAVVMLALFGQMERTYAIERAAHARAVATAKGRRIGRPSVVDPTKLAYAEHLRNEGHTIAQIVEKTGITRATLLPTPPTPPTTTPYRRRPTRQPSHHSAGVTGRARDVEPTGRLMQEDFLSPRSDVEKRIPRGALSIGTEGASVNNPGPAGWALPPAIRWRMSG